MYFKRPSLAKAMLKRVILGSIIPDTQRKRQKYQGQPGLQTVTLSHKQARQLEDCVFDLKIYCKAAEFKQHGAAAG